MNKLNQQLRKFYDRLGTRLDSQSFYEQSALNELINHGDFENAIDVFEFGCGTGRLANHLLDQKLPTNARYTATDISPHMVDISKQRLHDWQQRIHIELSNGEWPLPFQDQQFDRIIATFVIDLLCPSDAEHFFEEAHRLIKPGGLLCLTSISKGQGLISKMLMALWQGLYKIHPLITGGCRPVNLENMLPLNTWQIIHRNVFSRFGVTMVVLIVQTK